MPVVAFPGSDSMAGLFGDPNLDPHTHLKVVLQHLARCRHDWEAACDRNDELEEQGSALEHDLRRARADVHAAYAAWLEVAQQADTLAKDVRRGQPDSDTYERLYRVTFNDLKQQFDGGPHYDLLCERVAGLHVRLKRMEAGAREYPAIEHARLNQQLLKYIAQLQRYTEAMKSEQISAEAQDVAEKILIIVERSLSTSYPELWHVVVTDVRRALESAA